MQKTTYLAEIKQIWVTMTGDLDFSPKKNVGEIIFARWPQPSSPFPRSIP